jgi:radical SAM superfamily enzyme YgiQ (UPF0313 family)
MRVLLSSVCRPFGVEYGDGFGASHEGGHVLMWAQGIFQVRGAAEQWGIDFIAQNLKTPTVTLHYPSLKEFTAEIKKGYDFIGIAFVAATYHKMLPMIEAIRRHAPQSKIVLGGYGTAMEDKYLTPYADYICRGEGAAFMRELVGEDPSAPLEHPVITQRQTLCSIPLPSANSYLFAGLGCPNGCDFCATSHFFKRRYVPLIPDGASIVRVIQRVREKHPDINAFFVLDEDFLLNPKRGREYLETLRKTDLPPLSLRIFSSVKAISQYDPVELVEMGIDRIWVGFEGRRAEYSKLKGRPFDEVALDLRRHGISVIASMILGMDYQTEEIIREEFESLMKLRPCLIQLMLYGPTRGTPLYDRLKKEGRLREEVENDFRLQDGFTLGFKHPYITAERMSELQRELYREEFRRWGPSVFRIFGDWLEGWENLKKHPIPRVREKAIQGARSARQGLILLPAARRYVSPEAVKQLDRLEKDLTTQWGGWKPAERVMASTVIPAFYKWTDFRLKHRVGLQAKLMRKEFND